MIAAQGGDPDAPLPTARRSHTVHAPVAGELVRLDAYGDRRRRLAARGRAGPARRTR